MPPMVVNHTARTSYLVSHLVAQQALRLHGPSHRKRQLDTIYNLRFILISSYLLFSRLAQVAYLISLKPTRPSVSIPKSPHDQTSNLIPVTSLEEAAFGQDTGIVEASSREARDLITVISLFQEQLVLDKNPFSSSYSMR